MKVKSIFGEFRWSFLPPLMVYLAAGVAALTGIVGTFFVKEYLGLSAIFLAGLGFWAGLPWALKLPLGHLVDLIWRYKAWMIIAGAVVLAASSLIMLMLVLDRNFMESIFPIPVWFIIATISAPVGYVLQDVVADAMTVEAVPTKDDMGQPLEPERVKSMHITMQTLGRIAIIGGTLLVAIVNMAVFAGVDQLAENEKLDAYARIYAYSLIIPLISISGVLLAFIQQKIKLRTLTANGVPTEEAKLSIAPKQDNISPNWTILLGSAVFVVFSVSVGVSGVPFSQEIVFFGSLAIILFLLYRLMQELDVKAQKILIGTAIMVFIFRAMPGPGAGASWFEIDKLGFDQQFFSLLSLIAACLTIFGIIVLRPLMASSSMARLIIILSIAGGILYLPSIGLYYGVHNWTSSLTSGVVDARFIAIFNTALESPLGQVSMIPILAWIARSAPSHLKATFFAVLASFTNLALSASNLGTKYLNQIFVISREVKTETGMIKVAEDYSSLGLLLISVALLVLIIPMISVWLTQKSKFSSNI